MTWFGNEAKAVVGRPEGNPTNSKLSPHGNKPQKKWNHRTVAAELHADRLDVIKKQHVEKFVSDGNAPLHTYADTVTEVWNALSTDEKQECHDIVEMWNTGPVPKEIQRK